MHISSEALPIKLMPSCAPVAVSTQLWNMQIKVNALNASEASFCFTSIMNAKIHFWRPGIINIETCRKELAKPMYVKVANGSLQ